jgi:hypothetical protein
MIFVFLSDIFSSIQHQWRGFLDKIRAHEVVVEAKLACND